LNDHDLMTIQAATLFRFDERGRIVGSNEPNGTFGPRLFLGRTKDGHVARYGSTVPDALIQRVEEIVEREPRVGDLTPEPVVMDELRAALSQHAPVSREAGGPAYRFPESIASPGNVVQLTDTNRDLARDSFRWLYDDLPGWAPAFAVVDDGVAVSVCYSSRNGIDAAEAGVDTQSDYRGRGYAPAVTAAWAAAIRASGRIPLYSTAWDNHASRAVARRLGLVMYGVDMSWG
jgi:RimJ/RimL family protein N-acetyltransferase